MEEEKDEAFWAAMEKLDRRLDDRRRRKLDFKGGADLGDRARFKVGADLGE